MIGGGGRSTKRRLKWTQKIPWVGGPKEEGGLVMREEFHIAIPKGGEEHGKREKVRNRRRPKCIPMSFIRRGVKGRREKGGGEPAGG